MAKSKTIRQKKRRKKKIANISNADATRKQKIAFREVVENGRSKRQAMKIAGYSEALQNVPSKVTESKGWKELEKEYLGDDILAKVHREGLNACNKDGDADHNVRHKFLDTAYKIKGRYQDKGQPTNININLNLKEDEKVTVDETLDFILNGETYEHDTEEEERVE